MKSVFGDRMMLIGCLSNKLNNINILVFFFMCEDECFCFLNYFNFYFLLYVDECFFLEDFLSVFKCLCVRVDSLYIMLYILCLFL